MKTKYDSVPPSSVLIPSGGENDNYACALGQRLAKKFNIQCFVSCNVPDHLVGGLHAIEPVVRDRLRDVFSS